MGAARAVRAAVATVLVAACALAGCSSSGPKDPVEPADLDYDPSDLRVTGFLRREGTVASADGTAIATLAYLPRVNGTLPSGEAARFPLVVFVHGWAGSKERWEGDDPFAGTLAAGQAPAQGFNHLAEFAKAGFIAAAYDARGFGDSEGLSTLAGPQELADLEAVIQHLLAAHPTNGHVGLVGESYGAAQSMMSLGLPQVTTVAAVYGWADLYDGIVPGNVPKASWMHFFYATGNAASVARLDPQVHEWYAKAATRQGVHDVERQTASRDVEPALRRSDKPLLLCQGMQESLFPHLDRLHRAHAESGGFTRSYTFTGGHGTFDEGCRERIQDWMAYFLQAYDTGVADWPELEATDARGTSAVTYDGFPEPAWRSLHLRAPDLSPNASAETFTVTQRVVANPFDDPQAIWDAMGQPYNNVPGQLRQDPQATLFATPPLEAAVLFGAPLLLLDPVDATPPYQVVASLYVEDASGRSQLLARGAAAILDATDLEGGRMAIPMGWTKADIAAGERLLLEVGANEPSWYMPLAQPYTASFNGTSELRLGFFEG